MDISLFLEKHEIGVMAYFLKNKDASHHPLHSSIEDLVLVEFGRKFIKKAHNILNRNEPKKGFKITMPVYVARILKEQFQNLYFQNNLVMLLGKIDRALIDFHHAGNAVKSYFR